MEKRTFQWIYDEVDIRNAILINFNGKMSERRYDPSLDLFQSHG